MFSSARVGTALFIDRDFGHLMTQFLAVEWLAFLRFSMSVPGAGYPNTLFVVLLRLTGKLRDSALNYTTIASFNILSSSLFNYPYILSDDTV